MTTLAQAKRRLLDALLKLGIEAGEAKGEADLTFDHLLGWNTARQIAKADEELDESTLAKIEHVLLQRQRRIPIQYCLEEAWFMDTRLAVRPGVFIPRVDTETVVSVALEMIASRRRSSWRLAEIGIGSGAISISLLKRLKSATVSACDISRAACDLAAQNARTNGVGDRLLIEEGDWQEVLPYGLDAIISNPPYIPYAQRETLAPEVKDNEPPEALFGQDEDGLKFYRTLSRAAAKHFDQGSGFVVVEVGDGQAEAVKKIFSNAGWQRLSGHVDMNGLPRVVSASLK